MAKRAFDTVGDFTLTLTCGLNVLSDMFLVFLVGILSQETLTQKTLLLSLFVFGSTCSTTKFKGYDVHKQV